MGFSDSWGSVGAVADPIFQAEYPVALGRDPREDSGDDAMRLRMNGILRR
jgi:hypothetical protein